METFVHATNPIQALPDFLRVLKPGGRIALFEYDHAEMGKAPGDLAESMKQINKHAAMPANSSFDQEVLPELLRKIRFGDVKLEDLSEHIVPMLWIFYLFAIVSFYFVELFSFEHRLLNTLAAVTSYRGRHL